MTIINGKKAYKESDRLLARLVVSSLTIFIVLLIALGALLFRQMWLQQIIVDTSEHLQENMDELEETTSELQNELTDIRAVSDQDQIAESLDDISELLTDVEGQLDNVGYNIADIDDALEGAVEDSVLLSDDEEVATPQDPIDQVFTIFAVLISGTGIAIAILLGIAVKVNRQLEQQ